jgi:23S rRNA (uracil1939-C5)-methyltransferase
VQLLDAGSRALAYDLPEFGIRMPFKPTDFTQVNPQVNRLLVGYALRLLAVAPGERVIDWFCGLGNFTLPLATRAAEVVGVEGSKALVTRARDNAEAARRVAGAPRLGTTTFLDRNLFEMDADRLVADGTAQRWLLDPPREGAFALVKALSDLRQAPGPGWLGAGWLAPPSRLVYVSCNPGHAGTRCRSAGAPGRLPLRGRGCDQHVSPHCARGEHRGLRSDRLNHRPPRCTPLNAAGPCRQVCPWRPRTWSSCRRR